MPRCRPFKLIDTLILTAASALWMARCVLFRIKASRMGVPWFDYAIMINAGLTQAVQMLALAYVLIRLIPPRLPRSDLLRQPGMLLLELMIGLSIVWFALSGYIELWANMIIALALGLSWVAACRRYRSRAEPGWIEGLGRAVGVGVVVSIAAICPLYLLAS